MSFELGNMTPAQVEELLAECVHELPIKVVCRVLRQVLDDDDQAEVSAQLEDHI